jgi:hypothetical protein
LAEASCVAIDITIATVTTTQMLHLVAAFMTIPLVGPHLGYSSFRVFSINSGIAQLVASVIIIIIVIGTQRWWHTDAVVGPT